MFYLNLPYSTGDEYIWRLGIIISHGIFGILALAFGLYSKVLLKKDLEPIQQVWYLIYFAVCLSMLLAVSLTVFDQIVTPAINPLIIIPLIVSIALLLPPVPMLIIFIISYIVFFFSIQFTQSDLNILLSNRVNGLGIFVISFIISAILWKKNGDEQLSRETIFAQQKKLEEINQELIKQAEELKLLNSTKDKFFSIIAHDLINPIGSLKNLLEIISEKYKKIPVSELGDNLNVLKETSTNILALTQDLLSWSRSQNKTISFNPVEVDLKDIYIYTSEIFKTIAEQKKISMINDIPSGIIIYADVNMFTTILRNLLSNAIKFTPFEGEIAIGVKQSADKEPIIYVRDSGIGIIPEIISELFKIDSSFSTVGTYGERGTGLGLILCKEFVEIHGGKIWVESEVGKGSTFYFSLPIVKENTK
ncbi:MAG: HAMP domain-containing histidine kinase [Candidatus Kapabacteria bacterium]|nr:HAMP domain-containing histidine kinase [Ignavibacteriota bacterium]MCW5885773.1 HAMP domain-containing histidine kinase [Candidatus Kapabacteria bacterium]